MNQTYEVNVHHQRRSVDVVHQGNGAWNVYGWSDVRRQHPLGSFYAVTRPADRAAGIRWSARRGGRDYVDVATFADAVEHAGGWPHGSFRRAEWAGPR